MSAFPLLEVEGLERRFDVSAPWLNRVIERRPRQILKAVDGVSFAIPRGQTLALVGESGCGKSTIAKLVVGLYPPSGGTITFRGDERRVQMIFQDPFASLNPRWRVARIVAEPIRTLEPGRPDAEVEARVEELLRTVGLNASDGTKYPHEFSGGQRQRISIARALAGEVPSPIDPPRGCAFHPRCPLAFARCTTERPELEPAASVHQAACFAVGSIDLQQQAGDRAFVGSNST